MSDWRRVSERVSGMNDEELAAFTRGWLFEIRARLAMYVFGGLENLIAFAEFYHRYMRQEEPR